MNLGEREGLLLKILGENSRTTITSITKRLGCSRVTAARLLSKLEAELGIKYILEINEDALVPSEKHVVLVKFRKEPDVKRVGEFLSADTDVDAAYISGDNKNLVVLSRTADPSAYFTWEQKLAGALIPYSPVIKHSQYIKSHYGFFPQGDNFVDYIGKGIKVTPKDRQILGLLNRNSRMNYNELSRKTGMNEDTVHYRIYRLQRKGIIKRFTIAVQKSQNKNVGAYFADFAFSGGAGRYASFVDRLKLGSYTDRHGADPFQLVASVRGSFRLFLMGAFREGRGGAEKFAKKVAKEFRDDVGLERVENVRVLKGVLPFRSLGASGD